MRINELYAAGVAPEDACFAVDANGATRRVGLAALQSAMAVQVGTKTITENGDYDPADDGLDAYSGVTVNVSGGAVLTTKTITENGTYNASADNADGYSSVTVNVSGGGGDDPFTLTDFIESSGTQYIDTGYYVKENTRLEAVANLPNTSTLKILFGTREIASGDPNSKGCLMYPGGTSGNTTTVYAQFGGYQDSWSSIMSNYFGIKAVYRLSKGRWGIIAGWNSDGREVSYSNAPTTAYPLYLLALNNVGTPSIYSGNAKLYRFRIYEGDTLVHEFVPWTDVNNVVCLKDTVTGNLKYNAGTGVFTRGTDA